MGTFPAPWGEIPTGACPGVHTVDLTHDFLLIHKAQLRAKLIQEGTDTYKEQLLIINQERFSGSDIRFLGESIFNSNVDLSGANLSKITLLIGVNLSEVDLSGADLSEAQLIANLSRAKLVEADLSRANLSGADLRKADLTGAKLSNADLTEADLTEADLKGADLSNANLSRADLTEADLKGADVVGTIFEGATVKGTKFGDNLISSVSLKLNLQKRGAIFEETA